MKISVDALVKAYRTLHPKSRVVNIFKLYKNTSATKQMICIICDYVGPSWCSRYPKTNKSILWEHNHTFKHIRL